MNGINISTSFIIASSRPRALAEFYAQICNGKVSQGFSSDHYLIIYRGFNKIQIFKPSFERASSYKDLPTCSICFQKEPNANPLLTLREWCAEITLYGAKVFEKPRLEAFGAESWVLDPEGNKFIVFIPFKKDY